MAEDREPRKPSKYKIPAKHLGFGSSRKHLKAQQPKSQQQEESSAQIPLFFYEQAYIIQEAYAIDIAKIINKNIKSKHLREEAHYIVYDLIVKACYEYREERSTDLIKYVLWKVKCLLINWVKRELKQEAKQPINDGCRILAPMPSPKLIYNIEGKQDEDADSKQLAEVLRSYLKTRLHPFEYEVYYLSYCCGLSDVEISEQKQIERTRITRVRGNVVKYILANKDQIEKLFEED